MSCGQGHVQEYRGFQLELIHTSHPDRGEGFAVKAWWKGKVMGSSGYAGPNEEWATREGQYIIDRIYEAPLALP